MASRRHGLKRVARKALLTLGLTSLCISCSASTQSDNAVTQSDDITVQPEVTIALSDESTDQSQNTIKCLYTEGTQTYYFPYEVMLEAPDPEGQDRIAYKRLVKVWKSVTDDRYRIFVVDLDGPGASEETVYRGNNTKYNRAKGPGEPEVHYSEQQYTRGDGDRHFAINPSESVLGQPLQIEMTDGVVTRSTAAVESGATFLSYVADIPIEMECDEEIFDIDVPPKKPLTEVYLTDCDIALRSLMQAQVIEHAMEHHINELREQSTNGLAPADLEFAISEYDNMLNDLFAHVYEPLDTIEATCPTTGHAAQAHETAEVIRTSLAAMREAQAKLVAECESLEGCEAPVELTK